MEFWEVNLFIKANIEKQKREVYLAVLTGYYAAYYISAGKNAKSPAEIMRKTFSEKQTFEDGMAQINKIKHMEKRRT